MVFLVKVHAINALILTFLIRITGPTLNILGQLIWAFKKAILLRY